MNTAAPLQTVVSKSKPPGNSTHAGLLLQRKCACGSPMLSLTGKCTQCRNRILPTVANQAAVSEAAVNEVLASAGQPISEDARAFMESRFQRDFQGFVSIPTPAPRRARALCGPMRTRSAPALFSGRAAMRPVRAKAVDCSHTN